MKQIRNRFLGMGLQQVRTYSLTNDNDSVRFVSKENKKIVLLDPMSEDKKVMRQSIIPSLLQVLDYNNARNVNDVSIFEIGSVYYETDTYVEETKLSGLLYGNYMMNTWSHVNVPVDFYLLKGMMENLLDYLGLRGRYHFVCDQLLSDLHPGCSCAVQIDRDIVGYFGQVHPSISKKKVFVFELSLDQIMTKKVREIKYKEISKYPVSHKDLAFIVPKDMMAETVKQVIQKAGGRLLTDISVFDVYEGENVGDNEKSIAFSLTFGDMTRTLTDEEVTNIFNHIIESVESKLNVKLRNQ